jgi:8-oxo-dGTP diphosphatase
MDLEIRVGAHIYTTDFFQLSAFNPGHQIISIYYLAEALQVIRAPLRTRPFDFDQKQLGIYAATGETETFRFIDWKDFSAESLTLPIDKVVGAILQANY